MISRWRLRAPVRSPDYELAHEDDGPALRRQGAGYKIVMSAEASLIWSLCDGQRSIADIVDELRALFPNAPASLDQDVVDAVQRFALDGALRIVDTQNHTSVAQNPQFRSPYLTLATDPLSQSDTKAVVQGRPCVCALSRFVFAQGVRHEELTGSGQLRMWNSDTRVDGVLSVLASAAVRAGMDGGLVHQIADALQHHYPHARRLQQQVEAILRDLYVLGLIELWPLPGRLDEDRMWFQYEPQDGRRSDKAERLVRYCLGDHHFTPSKPMLPGDGDLVDPPNEHGVALLDVCDDRVALVGLRQSTVEGAGRPLDQKMLVQGWALQRARLPGRLLAWIIRGDGAGRDTKPSRGLHLGAVRRREHGHVVLVPSANRTRVLGPQLAAQMDSIRSMWTSWEVKSPTAWWGGDATGTGAFKPGVLNRFRFLRHFHDHPSHRVVAHPVAYPQWKADDVPEAKGRFDKRDAFRHMCVVLLSGNDIASGMTWFFCGNSVVLMQPHSHESIFLFELEPWVHYVPLEGDPQDVLRKLDWVVAHPGEAQRIVERAHERLRWLSGPEYLWACNEVLRRIASPAPASAGAPSG